MCCIASLFCSIAAITAKIDLASLKANSPFIKGIKKIPFVYDTIVSIKDVIGTTTSRIVNGGTEDNLYKQTNYISVPGFRTQAPDVFITKHICSNKTKENHLLQQMNTISSNHPILFYVENTICFTVLVLPSLNKTVFVLTPNYWRGNLSKVLNNRYIGMIYNFPHSYACRLCQRYPGKVSLLPLGFSYRLNPLIAYATYGEFFPFKKYVKKLDTLFEKLSQQYLTGILEQEMKVSVDYFGPFIKKDCYEKYIAYTKEKKPIPTDKKKCFHRSYALVTIKNIPGYEFFFIFKIG